MYDSGKFVIHALDETPKKVISADKSIENSVCKPRCLGKLLKFVHPRDFQFLSQDSQNHRSRLPRTLKRNCQTKTLSILSISISETLYQRTKYFHINQIFLAFNSFLTVDETRSFCGQCRSRSDCKELQSDL